MKNKFENSKSPDAGHSFRDWLDLHQVSAEDISAVLDMKSHLEKSAATKSTSDAHVIGTVSASSAWELASTSLTEAFPLLAEKTNQTQNKCKVTFGCVDEPYTIDHGPQVAPEIHINFQGSPSDILDVAHEFSHALQLIVRKSDAIPPIMREVAAFLGEMSLLVFMRSSGSAENLSIHAEWQRQNDRYLGSDIIRLRAALQLPEAQYSYRQNYPPARILAFLLFNFVEREKLTAIFTGDWSVSDCIEAVRQTVTMENLNNYFPDVPEKETQQAALELYRTLGMMTYLDLDYWKGQSEKTIEEYYGNLLHHIRSRSLYVVVGDENKPIGYATWNVDENDPNHIEITRQAAPFGDHLEVQRRLRARLPEATTASVIHERSARTRQSAW